MQTIKKIYISLKKTLPISWKVYFKKILFRIGVSVPNVRLDDDSVSSYIRFRKKYIANPKKIEGQKKEARSFKLQPKIDIIMPVYNTEVKWLDKAIRSISNQSYTNWNLLIVDDGSKNKTTKKYLNNLERADDRMLIKYLEKNSGIAKASNEAIRMGNGEFVLIFDHDDELEPDALFEIIKAINDNPELKLIYYDEDRPIGDRNNYDEIYFRPDWSPDLLLSMIYILHFVVQRKLLEKVGLFSDEFDKNVAHDYDLLLRCSLYLGRNEICHIPKVLYHWRFHPDAISSSSRVNKKEGLYRKKALQKYLVLKNIKAEVEKGIEPFSFRVRYKIQGCPLVSIIIPTKDSIYLLDNLLISIKRRTLYKNYEIIIVNNLSEKKESINYFKSLKDRKGIKVIDYPYKFNFSAINNYATTRYSLGKHLLFLNVDTQIISPGWLTAMLEHSQRKEVGAVGAKLLFGKGMHHNRIQHAGIILGIKTNNVAGHAFVLKRKDDNGYLGLLNTIRNVSAVTAACMMIEKNKFLEVGGFDEKNLPIRFNDVDLCLKLLGKGFYNVFTPFAVLYHYESYLIKKDSDDHVTQEVSYMLKKWGELLKNDPFYNPHLSLDFPDYRFDAKRAKKIYGMQSFYHHNKLQ